eukprot:6186851-Pleurochrysis_carterae.AAC.4
MATTCARGSYRLLRARGRAIRYPKASFAFNDVANLLFLSYWTLLMGVVLAMLLLVASPALSYIIILIRKSLIWVAALFDYAVNTRHQIVGTVTDKI